MPELDTVRGIAVLLVVVFHGFGVLFRPNQLSALHGVPKFFVAMTWLGATGVNLFFVLSGFLITGILIGSRTRPDYYRRFYVRRALRILPAYYLLLLVLPIATLSSRFPVHVGLPFVGLGFIYLANMAEFFGVDTQYGVLWSLAVEEHFYLLWPSVVKRTSTATLAWIGVAIVLMSPALRAWTPGSPAVTWQNLDGLAMGSVLAIRARTASRASLAWVAGCCVLLAVGGLAIGATLSIYESRSPVGFAFRNSIINIFYLGVLIGFLLVGTSRYSRWVNVRWLAFYGYISYGLYLAHMLVYDAYDAWRGPSDLTMGGLTIRFLVALVASTLLCWFMRATFEEWFLRMKNRRSPAASSLPQPFAT